MGKKKKDKQVMVASSPPANANPDLPQYYKVKLKTVQAQENWKHLASLEVKPSRYCHDETTQALGIHDDVWRLFDRIGWTYVMKERWPTYRDLTLEFLSTLSVTKGKKKPTTLHFQLGNAEHELTVEELNSIFKIPRGGVHDGFGSHLFEFWKKITNQEGILYNSSNSKASQVRNPVRNPVFRYIHRALASTVFARNDTSGMRKLELVVLYCMITSTNADFGYFLTEQFMNQAHTLSKVICIGGLITPIAEYLGVLPRSEPVPGDIFIDFTQLRWMRVLRSSTPSKSRYFFINEGLPDFPLPNSTLTSIMDESNWSMNTKTHVAVMRESEKESDDNTKVAENPHSDNPESFATLLGRRTREDTQENQMAYFGETLEAIRTEQEAIRTEQQVLRTEQHDRYTSFESRFATLESDVRMVRNDSTLMRIDIAQMLQLMRDWQVHSGAAYPPP